MTTQIPPSLERFGAELDRAARRELSGSSQSVRASVQRPRMLAGGSLGLAGVGAALALAISGAASSPAFAVTREQDGSVLVQLDYVSGQNLPRVNQKLAEMGTHEAISIQMTSGASPARGPVTCSPSPGVSGPAVQVLVGSDGTDSIAAGQSVGNTGEGSYHMVSCQTFAA
jgi:hypothetical protein